MAKASSSVTQTPLATLAVVAAVGVVAAALLVSMTEATWSVQARFRNIPVELSERFVATTTPLANEIYEIRFRNLDDVLFEQELQNDKSVLIGSCTSSVSVTANKYGWAYWRSSFNFSASVELSVIQLSMRQQAGYSPTQTEVISCGVGLPGANGRVYAKSQLSEADRYVSFTIRPSTSVGTYVFFSCTSPVRTTQQIYDETAIRDNGLCIQIWMSGDVWLQSLVAQLVQHLDCTSTDVDACNAFRAMARNPKYFAYDAVNAPQALTIAVPRAVTRSFNPSQNLVIGFALPQDRGQMYGLKNIAYRGIVEDNNFTISGWNDPFLRPLFRLVDVVTTPGTPAPLGTTALNMVMTENCLRGRNSSLATCPMVFLIVLDAATQADLDVSAPTAASDFAELGWYSNRTGAYFPSTFTASIAYTPAENGKRLGMFVTVSGYEGYDVAAVDVVQVYLPYSLFNSRGGSSPREPPTYNLTITVLPSAGNITSELTMDATKEILLWGGGFQRRITLGGESFTEAFASSFLNLTRVVGAADPAGGWEIWKRCALPAHAIYFERNAMTQAVDRRVLVLDFQPCPQYTMTVNNEVIEIDLPTQYLASGIPLATPPSIPLQFLITRSTPIFTWRGQDVWTVDDVLEGDVTFQIILQGGTTFRDGRSDLNIAADCAAQLRQLSYMSTNAPYRLGDGAGWNNSNVRASLLNANALTYIPDAYGTLTILNVTFPGNTAYFTLQGENISFAAIPAACVATSQDVIPPLGGLPPLQIKARVGVVSVLGAVAPDVAQAPLTQIAATNIRQGDVSLVIAAKANTDTFSQVLDGDALFSRKVADGIRCVSPQPFGFRALRLRIVNVSFVSPLEVRVRFMPVPQFAITTTELVSIGINGSWMSSRNEPTFATNTSFTILPSPGSIELVDAFVLQAPVVTEDDVRAGRLWFQFALIGDQWRQERAPYVAMFSGPAGEGTGLLALIDQLVPSIEFFNFTSSDTFQYLTVTLQSSDVYDISATETVKIAFSADAASSGLAPQFDQGDGTFAFSIQPTAGRLVVSGQTQLTEKLIREGGSTIFLTLFGDQWVRNAVQCVRDGIRIVTSETRDSLFNRTILPLYGDNIRLVDTQTLSIVLSAARSGTDVYTLGSSAQPDVLLMVMYGTCVVSLIPPLNGETRLSILPTLGELTLGGTTPTVVTEEVVRSQSVQIQIVVDGNSWANGIDQQPRSTALLEGFSSTSSPLQQPAGFLVHRDGLFALNSVSSSPDILKTSKSITVRTFPQPTYDITEDEVITFTVVDPSFMLDGTLPNPAQVSFVVKALPQLLTLLYQAPGGQFVKSQLETSVASVLSMPSLSANNGGVVATLTSQQGLLYVASLRFNVTPSDADPRTSVELLQALMALEPTYLQRTTGIRCAALAADSASLCSAIDETESPGVAASVEDPLISISYWVIAAVCVVALAVLAVVAAFLVHKRSLAGALRSGSHTHKMGRKTRVPQYVGKGPVGNSRSVAALASAPMTLREYALGQRQHQQPSQHGAGPDGADDDDLAVVVASHGSRRLQAVEQRDVRDQQQRRYEDLLNNPRATSAVRNMLELEG